MSDEAVREVNVRFWRCSRCECRFDTEGGIAVGNWPPACPGCARDAKAGLDKGRHGEGLEARDAVAEGAGAAPACSAVEPGTGHGCRLTEHAVAGRHFCSDADCGAWYTHPYPGCPPVEPSPPPPAAGSQGGEPVPMGGGYRCDFCGNAANVVVAVSEGRWLCGKCPNHAPPPAPPPCSRPVADDPRIESYRAVLRETEQERDGYKAERSTLAAEVSRLRAEVADGRAANRVLTEVRRALQTPGGGSVIDRATTLAAEVARLTEEVRSARQDVTTADLASERAAAEVTRLTGLLDLQRPCSKPGHVGGCGDCADERWEEKVENAQADTRAIDRRLSKAQGEIACLSARLADEEALAQRVADEANGLRAEVTRLSGELAAAASEALDAHYALDLGGQATWADCLAEIARLRAVEGAARAAEPLLYDCKEVYRLRAALSSSAAQPVGQVGSDATLAALATISNAIGTSCAPEVPAICEAIGDLHMRLASMSGFGRGDLRREVLSEVRAYMLERHWDGAEGLCRADIPGWPGEGGQ